MFETGDRVFVNFDIGLPRLGFVIDPIDDRVSAILFDDGSTEGHIMVVENFRLSRLEDIRA